jgi:thiol:disulfide interchange protein
MQDWMLGFVIIVVLALALYGLWDVFTKYRDWLVRHQPRTKRGRRIALAIGILVIVVLLIGWCAEMLRVG